MTASRRRVEPRGAARRSTATTVSPTAAISARSVITTSARPVVERTPSPSAFSQAMSGVGDALVASATTTIRLGPSGSASTERRRASNRATSTSMSSSCGSVACGSCHHHADRSLPARTIGAIHSSSGERSTACPSSQGAETSNASPIDDPSTTVTSSDTSSATGSLPLRPMGTVGRGVSAAQRASTSSGSSTLISVDASNRSPALDDGGGAGGNSTSASGASARATCTATLCSVSAGHTSWGRRTA